MKTTESGGPSGYDAGKTIEGWKRHIIADIHDRDSSPWLRHVFAGGGYAGETLVTVLVGQGDWTIEIIKCSETDVSRKTSRLSLKALSLGSNSHQCN